jgi:hypothetical protein
MGGLGARPVGHADPRDEPEGPQVPVTAVPVAPAPQQPPRITPWWEQGRPLIGHDAPLRPAVVPDEDTVPPGHDGPGPDVVPARPDVPVVEAVPAPAGEPASAGPAFVGLVDKVNDSKRTAVRQFADHVGEDRTARCCAFNGTAAALGYGLGLVPLLGSVLPAAEQGAVHMLSLVTATTGGYAAWWVTRFPAVTKILPHPPVSRVILVAGAAALGQQMAPLPVAWLNAHGERWGLGPSAVSLLLTAGGMCTGLWWLIDRRVRHWHWLARWIVRVPLASAVLATGLYAPGVTS